MPTPSPRPASAAPSLDPHEHGWTTESAHRTGDGIVVYVRCADCGTRRVDVQAHRHAPPTALSRALPA